MNRVVNVRNNMMLYKIEIRKGAIIQFWNRYFSPNLEWYREIRSLFQKYREFSVFSKIIHSFMNIYFVSVKVIPSRYCTLVSTFFFKSWNKNHFLWSCTGPLSMPSLSLQCRLYPFNRSIASNFHEPLQFQEQEKVTKARSGEYGSFISMLFLD